MCVCVCVSVCVCVCVCVCGCRRWDRRKQVLWETLLKFSNHPDTAVRQVTSSRQISEDNLGQTSEGESWTTLKYRRRKSQEAVYDSSSQVLVQTQTELWSDPIGRTPLRSQTEITGSGKRFERTIVWTMVWFCLIRGQFGLDGLIIVFLVWTMVWVRSGQRSIRSRRSDHSLFSLDHGLGSVWPEINSV